MSTPPAQVVPKAGVWVTAAVKQDQQTASNQLVKNNLKSQGLGFRKVDTRGVFCQEHSQEPGIIRPDSVPPANYETLFPWAPPTLSESWPGHGRAWQRGPGPSASHSEHELDDPIVAAARHNQTRPLLRLPDRILIGIIKRLDPVDVECLRRVSRRFPPPAAKVMVSREPASKNLILSRGPFPWPLLAEAFSAAEFTAARRRLLLRLDQDRYCSVCKTARRAPDWLSRVYKLRTYHWCSGCEGFHPACLFSAAQRRRQSPERKCVAREGYIRICGHKDGIVRWSDVVDIFERERGPDPPAFNGRRCLDISHRTACGEARVGEHAGQHMEAPDDYDEFPPIHIARHLDSSRRLEESLVTSWSPHVPLGRLGEWPPTASTLRRRLGELSDNAGRFMTLTAQPQMLELHELRCFDPNGCDCVYFEGSEDVDWRPYRPIQQERIERGNLDGATSKCYFDPAKRLLASPRRHRSLSSEPTPGPKPDAEKCLVAERVPHRARVRFLHRDSMHGPGDLIERYIVNRLPADGFNDIPESWYQSLDPDSYGLTTDADGYGDGARAWVLEDALLPASVQRLAPKHGKRQGEASRKNPRRDKYGNHEKYPKRQNQDGETSSSGSLGVMISDISSPPEILAVTTTITTAADVAAAPQRLCQ
ncbi:hypothetical protein KVR01_011901 [Diaporthe batatas]|uniref:uncharacterized protein n=1 Tax=Diaporthe batatas TaxID=748121 RepID=UPI001D039823|nr:uncharacterized protein KVR01_011901 [Diaporthe batatas]KAG8158140.1 hypothetical protein KVR01_011901 [Diaporthe batatas]